MTTLSSLTSALERCWTAIRTINPDVRDAALVVYLHQNCDRRGHFQENSWTTTNALKLDEVHISSHILAEGAQSVFRTLLHEACHSVATRRDVQDVSRQGRYHNKRFRDLARELGLTTAKEPGIGYVTPGITVRAQNTYANAIAELETAIELYQMLVPVGAGAGKGKGKRSRMLKLTCPVCHRIIRATRKTIELGPIVCGPCVAAFLEEHPL